MTGKRQHDTMHSLLFEGFSSKYPGWLDWAILGVVAILLGVVVLWLKAPLAAGPLLIPGAVAFSGAAALVALLVFGPPVFMLASFLFVLLTGHESLSFVTVSGYGVTWHLRELVLIVALIHVFVQTLRRRIVLTDSPIHYCMVMYGLFFILALVVGLYYGNSRAAVVGESRYALFLFAYPIFLSGLRTRAGVKQMAAFSCAVLLSIALCGLGYFVYAMISGNIMTTHNEFGAFVRRDIGGVLVQSVRPNGVGFFESAVVVLVALLFGARCGIQQRMGMAAAVCVFLAAILITIMRTAYISLTFSLLLLVLFSLPSVKRRLTIVILFVLGGLAAGVLLITLPSLYPPALNTIEVSIRARLVETLGVWSLFLERPLLGGGIGAGFEALGLVGQYAHMSYTPTEFYSVHNFFLYVLFKGGITGLLLVACGLGGLIAYGLYIMDRTGQDVDRAFIRGLLAAFLGQCLASLAMARFYFPAGQVFIAFVAAALYVFGRAQQQGSSAARQKSSGHDGHDSVCPSDRHAKG